MLRTEIRDALKAALKARDERRVSTVRLILAALKDRDIAARGPGAGGREEIPNEEILNLLQTMIKQRRDSIALYAKGGRQDLVDQETQEIKVIEEFLPTQLSDKEMAEAVKATIESIGATTLKDMGRTMAALKERYAGQMDFAKASAIVKQQLG
ncbi:MAG TPA: GatB/YqeY domain-containing protein [Alphaproteobacteria bacterium]|jgi:uncharacterized protein YqeY|nr:GatB/YqeY domain-containing protein [Alphaproteobacteria bacterium]